MGEDGAGRDRRQQHGTPFARRGNEHEDGPGDLQASGDQGDLIAAADGGEDHDHHRFVEELGEPGGREGRREDALDTPQDAPAQGGRIGRGRGSSSRDPASDLPTRRDGRRDRRSGRDVSRRVDRHVGVTEPDHLLGGAGMQGHGARELVLGQAGRQRDGAHLRRLRRMRAEEVHAQQAADPVPTIRLHEDLPRRGARQGRQGAEGLLAPHVDGRSHRLGLLLGQADASALPGW